MLRPLRVFVGCFVTISMLGFPFRGIAAPSDWTLKDLDGGRFTLSENLGKGPILVLFWATWCRPCKQEMKDYRTILKSYQEKGVRILAISEDNSKTQSQVKPFMKGNGYDFTVLLDPTGEVLKGYDGISIPYTLVLDSSGKVQKVYRGKIRDIDELSALLEKLLAETPGE
ncbi:MAG: TlpA disulfide reductase family protein [bacterium]